RLSAGPPQGKPFAPSGGGERSELRGPSGFPPGRPKESLLPPRGAADAVSFGGRHAFRRPAHAAHSSITLPLSPDSILANAVSYSSTGKWWVMIGDRSSPLCNIATILYQVSNISRT